jgi:hypothetical protein
MSHADSEPDHDDPARGSAGSRGTGRDAVALGAIGAFSAVLPKDLNAGHVNVTVNHRAGRRVRTTPGVAKVTAFACIDRQPAGGPVDQGAAPARRHEKIVDARKISH